MIRPIDPEALVALILRQLGPARRVAVDGPPPAAPGDLGESLVDGLRAAGRPAIHVRSQDFLRPASIRFELGRTNPDSYYERWVDLGALNREVLTKPDRVLPSLWNPVTDRATRASYVDLPPGGVVVVSGDLLLGSGLDLDLVVHLHMSSAALARRMPAELEWTLPAYDRYAQEVDPGLLADIVVHMNDPRHPAVGSTSQR